ncbi:MAG TPA: hypothetical protein VF392_01455 [Terracidiphilus sp.]
MKSAASSRPPFAALAAVSAAAFGLHGYHLGVEDSEIYLPAVKQLLHPDLYPFAPEFFLSHGRLSVFSPLVAGSARLLHASADWAILGWYALTVFAFVCACWMVAAACFDSTRARWCATLLAAAAMTMPATNTGLLLVDPYLTARSLSTPLTLFALAGLLEKRYVLAGLATLVTAAVHPQMAVYLLFLIVVLALLNRTRTGSRQPVPALASIAFVLPTGFQLTSATGPYREALFSRDYFFLYNWAWYHWLGMLAPLAILALIGRTPPRNTRPALRALCFAMLPFGLLSLAVALLFSTSPNFEMLARLQPLRTFHLITLVLILVLGGLAGEYLGRNRRWAIPALILPVAIGMFFADQSTYPSSPQIEWPSATSSNAWVNTLLWIRANTPQDAVFAVDSRYFLDHGVDEHGFRAISERSALADYYKDSGVVSLFPALAPEWKQMSNSTYGLNHFTAADFNRLEAQYPAVNWTVIHGAPPTGLSCPYQQHGYAVCRLAGSVTSNRQRTLISTPRANSSPIAQHRPALFWQNRTMERAQC